MCCKCSSFNGIEKYPKLRFPEFSEPWERVRIGDVYAERSERGAESAELLSVTMTEGVKRRSDIEGKDNSSEDKGNYKVVRIGDMVYNSMRMWQGANGISAYDGIVSPAYTVLTPKVEIANGFFGALFKTHRSISEFCRHSQGMTSDTWNLKYPQIETIRISMPVFREQQKISEFLSKIEIRIEKQLSLVEHLKKYKRGLLDKLLEDNKSDANWHIVRLQDVANGFDYGMNSAATTFDGVHKYIRITDIDDDSRQYLSDDIVSPSDTPEEKYRVCDNDILFARTGASVGKSYLYTLDDGELYFAGFLIRISVKKEYDSYFVYLNTLTSKYEKWLRLESMRSGQPGVNAEQYRNYAFRCPNYQTQVKIANIIKGIDLRILKERMSLSKLNSLKNGLLQQLFI